MDEDGDGPSDPVDTHFTYDGNQIILEFDDNGSLTNRYLWGAAVDQILADEQVTNPGQPGTVYWPLTDHLGTVRDLAQYDPQTSTTTVPVHRTYDAFGNLESETNPQAVDHLFGFTGKPFDDSTGLQNNLNRWYDPSVGRWLSEDPIGFSAGDANFFRYVENRSTSATDPSGNELFASDWPACQAALGWLSSEVKVTGHYQQLPSGYYHIYVSPGDLGKAIAKRDWSAKGTFDRAFYSALANWGYHQNLYTGKDGKVHRQECGVSTVEARHVAWALIDAGYGEAAVLGASHEMYENAASTGSVGWGSLAMAYPGEAVATGKGYFYNGPKEAVVGTYQMVRHPVQTAQGVYQAATHPGAAWEAIKAEYREKLKTPEGRGSAWFEGVTAVVTPSKAARELAEKGSKAVVAAARVARGADKPADAVRALENVNDVARHLDNVVAPHSAVPPARAYQSGPRMADSQLLRKNTNTSHAVNVTEWRRSISRSDIRAERIKFVGEDAVKVDAGTWRSLDGTRQFRTVPSDYLGRHGIGQPTVPNTPHLHFEFLAPPNPGGSNLRVLKNVHVPLVD